MSRTGIPTHSIGTSFISDMVDAHGRLRYQNLPKLPCVRVCRDSSSFYFPAKVYTKLQYNYKIFEIGSNWDSGNYWFNCPVSGYYYVAVHVNFYYVRDLEYVYLRVLPRDLRTLMHSWRTDFGNASSNRGDLYLTSVMKCSAGDKIYAEVYHSEYEYDHGVYALYYGYSSLSVALLAYD